MREPTRGFFIMGTLLLVNTYFLLTSYAHQEQLKDTSNNSMKHTLIELSERDSSLEHKTNMVLTHQLFSEGDIELVSFSTDSTEAYRQFEIKSVIATGYTAGIESTGKNPGHPLYGITYSGLEVKRDVLSTIAADPEILPLGTILYVPNYGYSIVADTGSAIKGNKIDLYYETVDDVFQEWGKQEVDVIIIERGDGSLTEEDFMYWEEQVQSGALPTFQEAI